MNSVTIKETRKGLGVFATQRFERGELVLVTQGVPVPTQTSHTLQISWEQHILPEPPIRFLNHSCDPNLGVKTSQRGLPDFYALQEIQPGDELTFDYAMTEYSLSALKANQREATLCCCETQRCRGRIGNYASLPQAVKDRYRGYISDYLLGFSPQGCEGQPR